MRHPASGLLALTLIVPVAGSAVEIVDPGQGSVLVPPGPDGASELSDIAYAPDGTYRLVSDDTSGGARVFTATIVLDSATGAVVGTPSIDGTLTLVAGADTEGLAIVAPDRLFVSDEVGPAIREHDAAGSVVTSVAIPDVFTAGVRANFGFEALAEEALAIPRGGSGSGGGLWTANEEALTSDGPVSSFTDGTIVRLQRFDELLQPAGQWGYVTDAIQGDIIGSGAGRDIERSGVVELLVLPNGVVLALERAFGGTPLPVFRSRIYALAFDAADDTSAEAALAIGSFVPVAKELLWEASFPFGGGLPNYEGMTLGPPLDNGDISLLLVSDDNGGSSEQSVYALRVTGLFVDVPSSEPGRRPVRVLANPVRHAARFEVEPGADRLDIFDVAGTRVASVAVDPDGFARWIARDAAPALYWARVRGSAGPATRFTVIR